MEKIRELVGEIGGSAELAEKLCEELERYSAALKEKNEKELSEKINTVKQICIEEVQKEKVNLARKVGIFLESKQKSIANSMTRQRVAEESEASATLKKARRLLEGVEIDGEVSNRELLAQRKKLERFEKAFAVVKEERDRAVGKANKANEIAVKTLKRNQLLEGKLKDAGLLTEAKGGMAKCECGAPLGEDMSKCPECGKTVVTGKEKKAAEKVAKESRNRKGLRALSEGKRLDGSRRKPAKRKSTQRTLIESEIPTKTYSRDGSPDISKIASEMPEI
jgi:hypothetical protein